MASKSLVILGIDENAGEEDIKHAYKSMLKKVHPDVGGNVLEFYKVQSAYEETIKNLGSKKTEFNLLGSEIEFKWVCERLAFSTITKA